MTLRRKARNRSPMKAIDSIAPLRLVGRLVAYIALIKDRSLATVHLRDVVTGAGVMAFLFILAGEATNGPLATPQPNLQLEKQDPTLIAVGTTPIRLSDAMAQAEISPVAVPEVSLAPMELFEAGFVDEVADQVALAKQAEHQGLDQSLEVRAKLALARRQILSTALLDLAVSKSVSNEKVRATYEAEVAAAAADQIVHLRRILVSSPQEAHDIREAVLAGEVTFANMAKRRSLDMDSRDEGGQLPQLRMSELPQQIAASVDTLSIGDVSEPIKGEVGWYVLTVDARSALRLPPFEEVRDQIERHLREEVVAETIAEARAAVPIRLAGTAIDDGLGPSFFASASLNLPNRW